MNRDIHLIARAFLPGGSGEGLFLDMQAFYFEQLRAGPVQTRGLLSAMSVVSAFSFVPSGCWCNPACVSAEVLADAVREYYGLPIESGDNRTREKGHQKLFNGHPVLALVRADMGTSYPYFGYSVVIRGMVNHGATVVLNDSWPDTQLWSEGEERARRRREVGEGKEVDWQVFDAS